MELTDLRHFHHVARTESFSRGAALSHVTAPAVSKSVKKLEDELGVRLFDRTTRRVALTAEGRALVERCARIFAELDALRAELGDGTVRGELRIGAMEVLSVAVLPRALSALLRAHPALRPHTFELAPTPMATALREGRIDVGLTIGGGGEIDMVAHELGRSPGVLVCGRGHPLHGRRRIGPDAVRAHASVVPRFLGLEHAPSIDQFPDLSWPRTVGATIELLQMGIALAEAGAFLGYFPEISVRAQLDDGRLHALAGLPERPPFVLRALVRAGAPRRPALQALLAALTAEIGAATAPRRRRRV
jgi:LysR family transcriptional regulator, carnitine catabolism transcriptional activator